MKQNEKIIAGIAGTELEDYPPLICDTEDYSAEIARRAIHCDQRYAAFRQLSEIKWIAEYKGKLPAEVMMEILVHYRFNPDAAKDEIKNRAEIAQMEADIDGARPIGLTRGWLKMVAIRDINELKRRNPELRARIADVNPCTFFVSDWDAENEQRLCLRIPTKDPNDSLALYWNHDMYQWRVLEEEIDEG